MSAKDRYDRNMKSNFMTTLCARFGGKLWVRLSARLGYVKTDFVNVVNMVVVERARARQGGAPR